MLWEHDRASRLLVIALGGWLGWLGFWDVGARFDLVPAAHYAFTVDVVQRRLND